MKNTFALFPFLLYCTPKGLPAHRSATPPSITPVTATGPGLVQECFPVDSCNISQWLPAAVVGAQGPKGPPGPKGDTGTTAVGATGPRGQSAVINGFSLYAANTIKGVIGGNGDLSSQQLLIPETPTFVGGTGEGEAVVTFGQMACLYKLDGCNSGFEKCYDKVSGVKNSLRPLDLIVYSGTVGFTVTPEKGSKLFQLRLDLQVIDNQ